MGFDFTATATKVWDYSLEKPIIGGVCAAVVVISLTCCFCTFCFRKSHPSTAKVISLIARTIIVGSLLAEDIFALLWQDSKFDDRNIFWIFYGFACIGACLELYTSCFKLIGVLLVIVIEIGQSILFMWICGWNFVPIYVFTVFCIVQTLLECATYCSEASTDDEDDDKVLERTMAITTACVKCCLAVVVGVGMLPYLYYNDDSPFRTQWFDIFVTCSIWFSTLSGTIMVKSILINPDLYTAALMCTLCVGLGTQIVVWILSIQYIDEARPGFEYGYTMFILIMVGLAICCFPCSVYYQWKNKDTLKQQLGALQSEEVSYDDQPGQTNQSQWDI